MTFPLLRQVKTTETKGAERQLNSQTHISNVPLMLAAQYMHDHYKNISDEREVIGLEVKLLTIW